jgi:hypothetical protein
MKVDSFTVHQTDVNSEPWASRKLAGGFPIRDLQSMACHAVTLSDMYGAAANSLETRSDVPFR